MYRISSYIVVNVMCYVMYLYVLYVLYGTRLTNILDYLLFVVHS